MAHPCVCRGGARRLGQRERTLLEAQQDHADEDDQGAVEGSESIAPWPRGCRRPDEEEDDSREETGERGCDPGRPGEDAGEECEGEEDCGTAVRGGGRGGD